MEITESNFTILLSRAEILALQKALIELRTLQSKYPDERNGFDLNSQGITNLIREKIAQALI